MSTPPKEKSKEKIIVTTESNQSAEELLKVPLERIEFQFTNFDAGSACGNIKKAHDICFQRWYANEFVRGTGKPLTQCERETKLYRKCLEAKLEALGIADLNLLEAPRTDTKESK